MKHDIKKRIRMYAALMAGVLFIFVTAVVINSSVHNSPTQTQPNPISGSGPKSSPHSRSVSSSKSLNKAGNKDHFVPSTNWKVAPKQLAIKQSVASEKEYRILAAVNDPLAQGRWYFSTVKAPEAWNVIDTSKHTVVAVIDSGVALNHEDLESQWAENSGENGITQAGDTCWTGTSVSKQSNNCDDDGNGYVDDWRGWDFYYVDNDPSAGSTDPYGEGVSHGTEVSGLVGAETNNALGVASIGYTNKIMPLQVMSDEGVGYTSDLVAAVYYAVDNGADVINMSLGSASDDPALKAALQYAYDNNVVVVAAAGNCGTMVNDGICDALPAGSITYPARYATVIAVGATDQNNQRAYFSSYGPKLDVVAPGSGTIASTTWTAANQTHAYATSLYGTSFASPIIASIAGATRATNSSLSPAAIKSILVANSQKVSTMSSHMYTEQLGHGVVNTYNALSLAERVKQTTNDPELLITGNLLAESMYTPNTTSGIGCQAITSSWCSIWLHSENGYDRYLPYQQLGDERTSWSLNTDVLGENYWQAQAISGNFVSSSRDMISKL